jgi:hypothetical protein
MDEAERKQTALALGCLSAGLRIGDYFVSFVDFTELDDQQALYVRAKEIIDALTLPLQVKTEDAPNRGLRFLLDRPGVGLPLETK